MPQPTRNSPRSSLLYAAATPTAKEKATQNKTVEQIMESSQAVIDQYCGYCLGEEKVSKAFYRTRNNVPVCRDWTAKTSHKMYILHTPTEISPSGGSQVEKAEAKKQKAGAA